MDTGYDIEWNGFLFLNQIKSDLSGLDNFDVNTNLRNTVIIYKNVQGLCIKSFRKKFVHLLQTLTFSVEKIKFSMNE